MIEIGFWPDYGYVLCGNVEDSCSWLLNMHCTPAVIVADPPYGDILDEYWDKAEINNWIKMLQSFEVFECPIYWWGGIGKINNRPFFEFILKVEKETNYKMRDLITWKKVRAYGKPKDYLFTREECALFTLNGEEPNTFHTPLLDVERGYEGYNKKYPAKSKFKRRSNVWCETELLRDKVHPAQKAPIVCKIPIEVNTNRGELVLDLYSGSGETSIQAIRKGRSFVAVERDKIIAEKICSRIIDELGEIANSGV